MEKKRQRQIALLAAHRRVTMAAEGTQKDDAAIEQGMTRAGRLSAACGVSSLTRTACAQNDATPKRKRPNNRSKSVAFKQHPVSAQRVGAGFGRSNDSSSADVGCWKCVGRLHSNFDWVSDCVVSLSLSLSLCVCTRSLARSALRRRSANVLALVRPRSVAARKPKPTTAATTTTRAHERSTRSFDRKCKKPVR